LELKRLVRHATFTEELTSDVPEWIARLATVPKSNGHLYRAAIYEIFVASLRGLGTLENYEVDIEEYFSETGTITSPADLKNAAALLAYAIGAVRLHVLQLSPATLDRWRTAVVDRVDTLLCASTGANARCALLDVRWFVAISPSPIHSSTTPTLDPAFPWLEQLTQEVNQAPLFPLNSLIDTLTRLQSVLPISDTPRYKALTASLDDVLGQREGGHAVAEKLHDRAVAFLESEQPLVALQFIHDANVKWFTGETLKGSLLAQLLLANIYASLGLYKAAQYFGLGEAFIALNSEDPSVRAMASKGIFSAAEHSYAGGEWTRFLDLIELGLKVHGQLAPCPGDLDRYPELTRISFYLSCIVVFLEKVSPANAKTMLSRAQGWGQDWLFEEMLGAGREAHRLDTTQKIWKDFEQQLLARPLSDAGRTRQLEWKQFGVHWRFRWKNTHKHGAIAEQLVATLQIVLADLANEDLCLLPGAVTVRVQVGPMNIVRRPSNSVSSWSVAIPENLDGIESTRSSIAVVGAILHELSVLSSSSFMSAIKNRFRAGLSSKTFIARPYEELFRSFFQAENIEKAAAVLPLRHKFTVREHKALAWRATPGPFYKADDVPGVLTRRYSRLIKPIQILVSNLVGEPPFQIVLAKLRRSGWRDWHILNAIYAVSLNFCAQAGGHNHSPDSMSQFGTAFAARTDISVPMDIFTENNLRDAQNLNMLSTLMYLGHELHQDTPSFRPISRFLGARYRYWTDDIEHADPFVVGS
jgi:hypothetical protein